MSSQPLPNASTNGSADPAGVSKPEWALSQRERRQAALRAAGLEPKRWRWVWPTALALLALAGTVLVLNGTESEAGSAAGTAPASESGPPSALILHPLDVTTVAAADLQDVLRMNGPVSPRLQVQLSAGVSGTVQRVGARLGDRITKGEVLVQIDIQTLGAQLAQQKGTLAANRAELMQAEGQMARSTTLAERGIAAAATLEKDARDLDVRRANLAAQQAQVDAAEIAVRQATILAPFDGIVAGRDVEAGQTVANGANLMQLADLATMVVHVSVPASSSGLVQPGQTVEFAIDGMEGRAFQGRVEGISPTAVAGSRNTAVTVVVDNADEVLRGGMFATGMIVLASAKAALALPPAAIREDDQGSFVLKIVGERLERHPVSVGKTWSGSGTVEILDGLSEGDRVVSGPLPDLTAGTPVRLSEV